MAKLAKKLTDTEINLFDGDGLMLRIAPLSKGGRKIGISGMQCQ